MIFKSLSIENIRSYKQQEINFSKGNSLFEGDIGSGKSSILMAIEFALFGLGNNKGDSLLRQGAKKGKVLLEFEVNGENYQVERNLTRKEKTGPARQGKCELGYSGSKIRYSPTEIKEKILEILNFKEPANPKSQSFIFRYAIYTPQEEMKTILSQKPDIRLQTLRKAFGIEDYKIAIENSLIISNYLKEIKSYLEGQIVDLNQKKRELVNLKENGLKNKKDLDELTQNLEKHDLMFKEEEKELEKLQSSESKINEIKAQIPLLKTQITDKKQLVEKYNLEIKKLEKENKDFNYSIEELKKVSKPSDLNELDVKEIIYTLRSTISKRNEISTKISILKENKTKLTSELADYEYDDESDLLKEKNLILDSLEIKKSLLAEKEESYNQILQTKYQIKASINEINQKINNLDGLGDICPVCDSKLDDSRKSKLQNEREIRLNEKNIELIKIDEIEKKTSFDLENLRSDITRDNNRLNNLDFIITKKEQINGLDLELNKLNKALNSLENYISSFKNESVTYSDPEDLFSYYEEKLEKIKHFNSVQKDISNLNNHLSQNDVKIGENIHEIKSISENIEKLSNDLSEAVIESEKLQNLSLQISEFKKTHKETKSTLESLKEKFIKTKTLLDSLKKEIEKINDEINNKEQIKQRSNIIHDNNIWIMDFLIPTLSLIEKKMMREIFEEFNDNFQKWFKILVDDYSKSARINEEFTPIIEQDNFEQDINYLSGGEKTSVAFAYRLALNNVVQKVSTSMDSNVLILDEPTDGFSTEQLFKIRDIFDELQCEQLIMVSHERELESFANHIFKVEKVDGYSTIVDL